MFSEQNSFTTKLQRAKDHIPTRFYENRRVQGAVSFVLGVIPATLYLTNHLPQIDNALLLGLTAASMLATGVGEGFVKNRERKTLQLQKSSGIGADELINDETAKYLAENAPKNRHGVIGDAALGAIQGWWPPFYPVIAANQLMEVLTYRRQARRYELAQKLG